MAIYYNEAQKSIFDSITKELLRLENFVNEIVEYRDPADEADVGGYDFYEEKVTKICHYKNSLLLILVWGDGAVKISPKQKEEILKDWKSQLSSEITYEGSSAVDELRGSRARR